MINSKNFYLKRIISFIVIVLSLSFFSYTIIARADDPINPGETKENPIIIKSKTDFESFIDEINSGNTFENQYIKLGNDINLNSTEKISGKIIDWSSAGYCLLNSNNKVSSSSMAFQGNFDGNGYTINCNVNFLKNNSKGLAIFGYIGEHAKIENINVTGYIKGNHFNKASAGLCDVNFGTLENCNVKFNEIYGTYGSSGICNVNFGTIKNCEAKGKITAKDFVCSGICGTNYGEIENCKSLCLINNCIENGIDDNGIYKMPESAGISSYNYGKIVNCESKSFILNANINNIKDGAEYYINRQINTPESHDGCIGGIVSRNNGLIDNCKFFGHINGYQAGGICAINYETVSNCSADCTLRGLIIGGISAQNIVGDKKIAYKDVIDIPGGNIENCTFSGNINSLYLYGNIICEDFWKDSHATVKNCKYIQKSQK